MSPRLSISQNLQPSTTNSEVANHNQRSAHEVTSDQQPASSVSTNHINRDIQTSRVQEQLQAALVNSDANEPQVALTAAELRRLLASAQANAAPTYSSETEDNSKIRYDH